jgi:hypothetical protein
VTPGSFVEIKVEGISVYATVFILLIFIGYMFRLYDHLQAHIYTLEINTIDNGSVAFMTLVNVVDNGDTFLVTVDAVAAVELSFVES